MPELRTDDPTLLGRPELVTDLGPSLAALASRRILLTGAAGSLGTLLAVALVDVPGVHLSLLDHHEHSLFSLQRVLTSAGGSCSFVLADVRDTPRMKRVLATERPDVVIHFAAYKHVHYGELFPEEAVGVNVLATRDLLRLAEASGVERFVYPSSDKACNPPSLYGACKRIGEVLVRASAARGAASAAVRYMNVLGTRGSVLETFAAQIREGRPLTVTDPAMTRYWISPREAVWLALQAARAAPGSLLMLDVRQDVAVVEMASRLAAQHDPRELPYPIVVTGRRPGERLYEELLGPHDLPVAGPEPGLLRVEDEQLEAHVARVDQAVEELAVLHREGRSDALRDAAMCIARDLQ